MLRTIATTVARQNGNGYWSEITLGMEMVARLSDNRKIFCLPYKATIIQGTVSEMVQDSNGVSVKSIMDRFVRWISR